jgi:hypothetical protein
LILDRSLHCSWPAGREGFDKHRRILDVHIHIWLVAGDITMRWVLGSAISHQSSAISHQPLSPGFLLVLQSAHSSPIKGRHRRMAGKVLRGCVSIHLYRTYLTSFYIFYSVISWSVDASHLIIALYPAQPPHQPPHLIPRSPRPSAYSPQSPSAAPRRPKQRLPLRIAPDPPSPLIAPPRRLNRWR